MNLVNRALNAVVNAARNLLTPVVRAIDTLVAGTNNSVDTQGPDAGEVLNEGGGSSGWQWLPDLGPIGWAQNIISFFARGLNVPWTFFSTSRQWPSSIQRGRGSNLQALLAHYGMTINTPSASKVSVSVIGNIITVTTAFRFCRLLCCARHENLFLQGVRDHWNGRYNVFGHNITLNLVTDNRLRRICVIMLHESGIPNATEGAPITTQPVSTIWMYSIYNPESRELTDSEYRFAAAHELGHIFGLQHTVGSPPSIMSASRTNTVTDIDVEALIRAYATNLAQRPG